ncbi:hypothetical protein ACFFKC_08550 [Pseudoduganella danionis]|uniref:Virion structural protein n=1 Tax=Pseudoduganella danionis TaxID=1890295 RepID=A0ABW9SUN9_9BURK|nr:hypothetical protein [Pseudoduganella danionis]MTW34873.1 hypothetical protein [Pseudoduganella danionis]
MQATIYISTEAMTTVNAIAHLDYYDRVSLSDDPATDLTATPGYYLNTNALKLNELPADAKVAVTLSPFDPSTYQQHISIPTNLRGVIFSGAPNLPENYAQIIAYWSPIHLTNYHRGALYYQNVQNEYCVALAEPDDDGESETIDTLVSDALVVVLTGLAATVIDLHPDDFVALTVPINAEMLGIELDGYRSPKDYPVGDQWQSETLFLRVADILTSPNPDYIAIAAIRTELGDYGYTY